MSSRFFTRKIEMRRNQPIVAMFRRLPYSHPEDALLTRSYRRCTKPKYDDGREKYTLAPMSAIYEPAPLFPADERWVSPMCQEMRAPQLSNVRWTTEEGLLLPLWDMPGARIQIYSIITSLNIKTIYVLERSSHPTKKWRRIIMSYHLSEERLFDPHSVDECTL